MDDKELAELQAVNEVNRVTEKVISELKNNLDKLPNDVAERLRRKFQEFDNRALEQRVRLARAAGIHNKDEDTDEEVQ